MGQLCVITFCSVAKTLLWGLQQHPPRPVPADWTGEYFNEGSLHWNMGKSNIKVSLAYYKISTFHRLTPKRGGVNTY